MAYLTNIRQNVRDVHEKILGLCAGMATSRTKLLVIHVGSEDDPSERYLRSKVKAGERCNVDVEILRFPTDTATTEDLVSAIRDAKDNVDGIIIQLPVPRRIDLQAVYAEIPPDLDVDGVTPENIGRLAKGYEGMIPCTPKGIMTILDDHKIDVEGKHVVIVGRSDIVGKPLAMLMTNRNATVTLCHSKTGVYNLMRLCREADIIVSAVGKPRWLTKDYVSEGTLVIDVGINVVNGKVVGDVDPSVAEIADVTPVPNGVGLTTVLSLMQNTVESHLNRHR